MSAVAHPQTFFASPEPRSMRVIDEGELSREGIEPVGASARALLVGATGGATAVESVIIELTIHKKEVEEPVRVGPKTA
jgi:hypothetical protein